MDGNDPLGLSLSTADKKKIEILAMDLRRELCQTEKLNTMIVFGLGTINAHAKNRSLEQWIIAYGKANG